MSGAVCCFQFLNVIVEKKILGSEIPSGWLEVLVRNIWHFRFLEEDHQQRIIQTVQIMASEKSWEGASQFAIDPEIKITISGAAGLLTLGLDEPYYFDRVKTIIVHPDTIHNETLQDGLIVDRDNAYFDGQAWQGGPVVFSWPAVISGTRHGGDGRNVVIHEFAHHIDGLDGSMGGNPIITSTELRERWETEFVRDYEQLVQNIRLGHVPTIDPYAGTSKAEYFAVTSEIFFDSPHFLFQSLPDTYQCLAEFYGIDPLAYH